MRLLLWLVTHALSLAAAAWLIEGVRFAGPDAGRAELSEKAVPLLVVALVLGVVTAVVRPVLRILSIPFIILTLGLFLLVINAALLRLTAWVARGLDLGFFVDSWGAAILGAIVITVVTWLLDAVLERD